MTVNEARDADEPSEAELNRFGDDGAVTFLDGEPEAVPPEIVCRRCRKSVSAFARICPYCYLTMAAHSAPSAGGGSRRRRANRSDELPIGPLMGVYGAMLGTSVLWGWFCRFGVSHDVLENIDTAKTLAVELSAVEAVDTILVLWACLALKPPRSRWWNGTRRAAFAWISGAALLVVMLAANIGYHNLLREALQIPEADQLLGGFEELRWISIALICVQPAIVEEFFFRYLMLGHARSVMGVHAAVLITGIMFGAAHLGQPLSIPMLTLLGIGLGYARVWGGGLLLPIVLHFLHNLVIIHYT